ncbi:glycerol-3-phosphate acyltransferase 3-like [Trichonephila clavata]|uniref:Glycerol-3-phosphate acyltransferase 3-like n=1 Tax=Trichonephila clavata TaxID=2740835 RepID=A0A8X6L0M4_TRICU|nr:glycerol-3-phosphate acyltransferase 3-like [Trichonephila clavata]
MIMVLVIIFVLFIASLGRSLGLHDSYAKLLLKLFEFCQRKIEKAERRDEEDDDPDGEPGETANSCNSVISREVKLVPDPCPEGGEPQQNSVLSRDQKEFRLEDIFDFVKTGVEAVIEDEVTMRFAAEELPAWNLLTRTNKNYQYISFRVTCIWGIGFFLRYVILFPLRVCITFLGVCWLLLFTFIVGCFPDSRFKRWLYWHGSILCFRVFACACSAVVTYHNRENRAVNGGICVANHTSPIDVVILANDNSYALVGQSHGGFLGVLQSGLGRATSHIWFERGEVRDRELVQKRLKGHVQDENKLPILIFPEGTCINNTSVMMFKKGSFEVGGTIYPVAIKYDPRFGDAFWDSSKQSYMQYLVMMLTSWALVCDVWYLPPMTRKSSESAVEFANRVKAEIAKKGGLVDLMWDGQLKRIKVKQEWIAKQQKEYSKRLKVE